MKSPSPKKTRLKSKQEVGRLGEAQAAFFLQKCGMQILGKNIVLKAGEIDILAQDTDKTIVLVEVKALSGKGVLDPESKLGPIKRKKLHLLARILEARYPGQNIRVDAVALYWKSGVAQINHYKNIIT